ncbi:MAG: alpha/beta fold hydrolase [Methylocystis sp.]|uniref:alpha/beta fold hydrolase n=1 Tax=Methylocystis sp. TaxID=1911079 RepID=UPI003DA245EB
MLNDVIFGLLGFVVMSAAIVPLSLLVEAMRPVPPTPVRLSWAPDTPIRYVSANGVRLRYIKTGEGPALVLLHTLRTQLDLFEKVVPDLAKSFTVYAVDYPGHGYSDIPPAKYDAAYFVETIEDFLQALDLHEVTLAGVSIGASISLIIAARNNPRVSRVVAINPTITRRGAGWRAAPLSRVSSSPWRICQSSATQ